MGVSLPIRAGRKRRRRCALPRALQNTVVLPRTCLGMHPKHSLQTDRRCERSRRRQLPSRVEFGEGWSLSRCDRQAPRPAVQRSHVRTPLRSRQDFSGHIAGHIGEAIGVSVVEAGQSLVIHAEQMEHGGDRVHSHDPFRLCSRGDEASNALERRGIVFDRFSQRPRVSAG